MCANNTYRGPQEPTLRLDEDYDIGQHELINVRLNIRMTHDHRSQADDDAQCTEFLLWGRSTAQIQSSARQMGGKLITHSPPVSTLCARPRIGIKVVLVRPVAIVNKKEEAADAGLW